MIWQSLDSPLSKIGTAMLDEFAKHTACYFLGFKSCEIEETMRSFIITRSQDVVAWWHFGYLKPHFATKWTTQSHMGLGLESDAKLNSDVYS